MTLILIGGAPGSGKSTLATQLAHATGLPSLGRDEVKRALTAARGALATDSTEIFYGLVDAFVDAGVSLIADHTFELGNPNTPAIKVAPIARWMRTTRLVALWCWTPEAAERANRRDRLGASGDRTATALPVSYWDPPAGVPVIFVDTTGALKPTIEELVAIIANATSSDR